MTKHENMEATHFILIIYDIALFDEQSDQTPQNKLQQDA